LEAKAFHNVLSETHFSKVIVHAGSPVSERNLNGIGNYLIPPIEAYISTLCGFKEKEALIIVSDSHT
jgi:hypothetical protein